MAPIFEETSPFSQHDPSWSGPSQHSFPTMPSPSHSVTHLLWLIISKSHSDFCVYLLVFFLRRFFSFFMTQPDCHFFHEAFPGLGPCSSPSHPNQSQSHHRDLCFSPFPCPISSLCVCVCVCLLHQNLSSFRARPALLISLTSRPFLE